MSTFSLTDAGQPSIPVLRSQADVESMWRVLMQPLGWRERSLWFVLVGADDAPWPQVFEIGALPDEVDAEMYVNAARVWRDLLDDVLPSGRVALLLTRSGGGGPDQFDRTLAAGTYAACRAAGVPLEVIHLATDEEVCPLPAGVVACS